MNSTVPQAQFGDAAARASSRLAGVLLARVGAGAVSETQLARDLRPLLAHPPAEDAWRLQVARLAAALVSTGHLSRADDQLSATPAGQAAVMTFLGTRKSLPATWTQLRDGPLMALALGMSSAPASRLKALGKPDGLRALIVEAAWKLKLKGKPSASRIRQALALVALERAFGNQVKNEVGAKSALSPKASRLLAGQLAARPRDFGTDGRLVAALAAEAVESKRGDLASLRLGVLKRFLHEGAGEASKVHAAAARHPPPVEPVAPPAAGASVPATSSKSPAPHPVPSSPPAPRRPDPQGFARAVKAAAGTRAEGWPGNRRAYVSLVWETVRERHPEWAISEIEFKAMLTEAHRTGLLVLANADLKDKRRLKEVQESAITYKNTVWHYIRVED